MYGGMVVTGSAVYTRAWTLDLGFRRLHSTKLKQRNFYTYTIPRLHILYTILRICMDAETGEPCNTAWQIYGNIMVGAMPLLVVAAAMLLPCWVCQRVMCIYQHVVLLHVSNALIT